MNFLTKKKITWRKGGVVESKKKKKFKHKTQSIEHQTRTHRTNRQTQTSIN